MTRKRVFALLLCVMTMSAAGAGDILQTLGYAKEQAESEVVFAIALGQVGLGEAAKVFKPASEATKIAIVEQTMLWTKAYTATRQFEEKYQEFREQYQPSEDDAEAMAQWKRDFPATGREAVKKRLREFLAESANVDFDAKLVRKGSKMVFATEAYESDRSSEWKMCYRAGKAPVAKARAIAQAWLKELGG